MEAEKAVHSFWIYLIVTLFTAIFFCLSPAGRYSFSVYAVIAIILGVSTSFAAGYFFERKELKKIEQKGENSVTSIKILLLTCFLTSLIASYIIVGVVSADYSNWKINMNFLTSALVYFVFPMATTIFIPRILLMKKWEQKHNRILLIERKYVIAERTYASPPLSK